MTMSRGRGGCFRTWRSVPLGAVLLLAGCVDGPPRGDGPAPVEMVTVASGARGGSFHAMGEALLRMRQAEGVAAPLENVETAGSVSNLKALQQGTAECAFSYADVAYDAMVGRLPDAPAPFDQLRGVALVQLSPLYFLVLRDSPVQRVTDLRARTVALRSRDSGSLQAAMLVLEAYGLDAASINIQSESFTGSFARLLDGSVDALFILTGQPSESISQAVASRARIVALAGPPIDRLRERYPFLRPTLILAGSYPGHPTPIRTVGVESVLLCRADVPAVRVYEMTQTWFLTASQSSTDGPMSGPISPARAAATPVPLHPGAARYYRERQLLP